MTKLRALTVFALLGLGVGLGGMAACDGQANDGTVAPGSVGGSDSSDFAPDGRPDGESPQQLADRLRELAAQQRNMTALADQDPAECEDLCSLSTSICGVKEKLCRIADERVGEESYQQLCREAKQECRDAQESCMNCVENHVRGKPSEPASTEAAEPSSPLRQPEDAGSAKTQDAR